RYGLYAAALLYVAMSLVLLHGFLTHDFSNKYITAYSDRSMPTLYLMASFWGGEKGALLLWTTSLSIFGAISIHTRRTREPVYLSWALAVLALAIFFFDVLMVFESNPFEVFVTSAGPMDGKGLNPLLQNPTMAFHPPSLLTGYIAFTIPFAFGMAALITGKLDAQWIADSRTWTIISWCFLSVGLVLGALWAYEELGWGFYWMWDPVENAGFIPWLTGTAYLHSVMIQERRGMLRRWNVVLVCLTFLLTIFGTFLTRSQLIDSIHAFADSTLAIYFLWYMLIIGLISGALIAWRWKALRADHDIESLWSRESMFVMNNVFLVGSAFIVMWGTLFPKISELKSVQGAYNVFVGAWNGSVGSLLGPMERLDQAVSLAEPWFNRVMTPIGLLLLLVMG
ncbi:MAG: cytochrome c biogenesis protein CcsA, partial [Myxococcota bacterium]|nr:cytochrome c biogenesis protein CcsA [Myxococcota bacterium]